MNWNDILRPYSSRMLSHMCSVHGLKEYVDMVTPKNRARVIDSLRHQMGKPEFVHAALEKIGPVEMLIIRILLSRGGQSDTDTIHNIVDQESPLKLLSPAAVPSPFYKGNPSFDDAVLRATCYGLVFTRDYHEIDVKPGRFIFIPEQVMHIINTDPAWRMALAQTAQEIKASLVPTPDAALTIEAADFQRDLSRYLRHVRKEKEVALTTVGWIYKSSFKTFLAALNAPAEAPADEATNGRLWYMRRLLNAMGELELAANCMRPNPEGSLLTQPMAQRIKLAFTAWSETGAWNELNRITTDHQGYDYRRDAPPELSKARAAVLRAIARLSASIPDAWIGATSLIEFIRRSDYQFLFPRKYNYREMYGSVSFFSTPYYANNNPFNMSFTGVKDERSGWENVERQVIVNILSGPLYWMGLISLGYDKVQSATENVEPVAFRLTQAGAWLLGLAEQPEFVESGGRVLVQPNFTIIAMEPVSDAVLLALDEFAESQGGDRAVTYHLTRQSVYQAQRQDWNAKRIAAFLEQHQGAAIPLNVQRSLDEWQVQHQRITFHRSTPLIQYADVKARDGVQQALRGAGLATRSIAPFFDLIDAPSIPSAASGALALTEALSAALNAAGWLPLMTPAGDGASSIHNAIRLTDTAEVLFKEAAPDLRALSQLQPFTERAGEQLRITAPSVRAAMSNGVTLDQLLAELAHLHDGPISPKVENDIRAWAGFYGDASLRPVHLLELSSLEVLNNLLNDELVGQYLRPIDASVFPLALVDAGNVELVKRVLVERGVTLKP